MSTSPPDLVLITGATGLIGADATRALLSAGYRVRLTIRRPEQRKKLKRVLSPFISPSSSTTKSRLQFVLVPDLTAPGAFDRALADGEVKVILHNASPVYSVDEGADPVRGYIDPAIRATLEVLEAAKRQGGVRRVVVMSSVMALVPHGATFSEEMSFARDNANIPLTADPAAMPDLDRFGFFAGHNLYHASKILAHRAWRDWLRENPYDSTTTTPGPDSPTRDFTSVALHPSYVLGPSVLAERPDDIGSSCAHFWAALRSDLPVFPATCVDVRDVAEACVRVAGGTTTPSSNTTTTSTTGEEYDVRDGDEFLLSAPRFDWADVAAFAAQAYPDLGVELGGRNYLPGRIEVDASAAEGRLGMRWRGVEEMVRGVVDQQLELMGRVKREGKVEGGEGKGKEEGGKAKEKEVVGGAEEVSV